MAGSNDARKAPRSKWDLVAALALMLLIAAMSAAKAQDHQGRHGVGHDKWHADFYSKLIRKDTRTSCCNLSDCVPTESRRGTSGQYQVLVDGEWTDVPQIAIQNVTAPDQGAHVCFPKQPNAYWPKGTIFCAVLPPDS